MPIVVKLFSSTDRMTRISLLQKLDQYVEYLSCEGSPLPRSQGSVSVRLAARLKGGRGIPCLRLPSGRNVLWLWQPLWWGSRCWRLL